MGISISKENGRVPVTIMHPRGDLDSSNYMDFQAKADEMIDAGAQFMLLDFSEVPYVSSAGFRSIQHIFNRLRQLHPSANLSEAEVRQGINAGTYTSPHLKLLHLSKESLNTFKMTGFDMYLEIYNDLKEAISSY